MRMAGPDIVLFVIGALLFGGAGYAILTTPGGGLGGAGSSLGLFDVHWGTQTSELESQAVASFRSASADFTVTAMNVTQLDVVVACADPLPGPAAFNLAIQVTGPNGLTGSASGACGQAITVPIDVAPVPASASAQGAREEEARANLATFPNATAAVGPWNVAVSGNRAGAPSPIGLPAGDPGGSITLNAIQWTPRLTPVTR